jgi:hypothetical protein
MITVSNMDNFDLGSVYLAAISNLWFELFPLASNLHFSLLKFEYST